MQLALARCCKKWLSVLWGLKPVMHKCANCGDRMVLIGKNNNPLFQLAQFFMLVPIENMKFKSELDKKTKEFSKNIFSPWLRRGSSWQNADERRRRCWKPRWTTGSFFHTAILSFIKKWFFLPWHNRGCLQECGQFEPRSQLNCSPCPRFCEMSMYRKIRLCLGKTYLIRPSTSSMLKKIRLHTSREGPLG